LKSGRPTGILDASVSLTPQEISSAECTTPVEPEPTVTEDPSDCHRSLVRPQVGGWVVTEFVDHGVSGTKEKRPSVAARSTSSRA